MLRRPVQLTLESMLDALESRSRANRSPGAGSSARGAILFLWLVVTGSGCSFHAPAYPPSAVLTGTACLVATTALGLAGRPLVGGTLHLVAQASAGAQVVLTPLARLIGEPEFGRLTQAAIAAGEGALFGLGLALGLTGRR